MKITQKDTVYDSICQIIKIYNNYDVFCVYDIKDEVDKFFSDLSFADNLQGKNANDFSDVQQKSMRKEYKNHLHSYFKNILSDNSCENTLSILLKLLMILLKCDNFNSKFFISFDNFERFVGADEIFSSELVSFIDYLRHFVDSIAHEFDDLGKYFKFILFVRNTSTRMFTPQQISDFAPHELDITDWFSTKQIIEKKIDWYGEKNIEINDVEIIKQVLSDFGSYKNEFYGLRPKLDMLFNYNKRIVVEFLTKTFTYEYNDRYLKMYDYFWNKEKKLPHYLRKFAARTIITRLIYNQLRSDGFFKNIIVQRETRTENSKGYARRILTILNNFKLDNASNPDRPTRIRQNIYMPLNELINKLFPNDCNSVERYFSEENRNRRKVIAKVLFFMNYYNRRSGNWLQFVDIQYNVNRSNVRISDEEALYTFIDNNHDDIKLRITNSGIAYLSYIVQSFEYFSSKYYDLNNKKDFPPLLCCIPTIDELKNNSLDEIECLMIIKEVSQEAMHCIEQMNKQDVNKIILHRENASDIGLTHAQRIVNYHKGYLDNFIECCDRMLSNEITDDRELSIKYSCFVKEIIKVRNSYKAN